MPLYYTQFKGNLFKTLFWANERVFPGKFLPSCYFSFNPMNVFSSFNKKRGRENGRLILAEKIGLFSFSGTIPLSGVGSYGLQQQFFSFITMHKPTFLPIKKRAAKVN